jgi:hypothetical protein
MQVFYDRQVQVYHSFVHWHSLEVNFLMISIKQSISRSHVYGEETHFAHTSLILKLSYKSKRSDISTQNILFESFVLAPPSPFLLSPELLKLIRNYPSLASTITEYNQVPR